MRFVSLLPLAAAAALVACTETDAQTSDGGTFTPVQGDFQSFHSWQSFTFMGEAIPDSPHLAAGPRTDYVNQRPAPGAKEFPVGTIIVKELDGSPQIDPLTARQVFAMVKVGGGYNAQGAVDWEWYELQNNADSSVSILWNGVVPPAGEKYANTGITCNACHGGAQANDYVQSPPLQLSALELSDGGSIGDAEAFTGGDQ
jgi:hypothetical protein